MEKCKRTQLELNLYRDNTLASFTNDSISMLDEILNKMDSTKEFNLKIAFEKTFGKPLDINKVCMSRMQHFVNTQTQVEHYCYCNRVFMITHTKFDTKDMSYKLYFEIPPKLYYTRRNGRVEFVDKSK